MKPYVHPLFQQAVEIEEGNPALAAALYEKLLEADPTHAEGHINIGTLRYNAKQYDKALWHYRMAARIKPDYALAYFDIGNTLSELLQPEAALTAYQRALEIDPNYADCHYNLAILFDEGHRYSESFRHWQAYVRLDRNSQWGKHAAIKLAQAKELMAIRLVHTNAAPVRTPDRAALLLVPKKETAPAPAKPDVAGFYRPACPSRFDGPDGVA